MQWVAPSEKDSATDTLEKRLWDAADQFRANSGLSTAQYSQPVLGLIFLRFAEVRFSKQRAALETVASSSRRGSRVDDASAYHADGILYQPANKQLLAKLKGLLVLDWRKRQTSQARVRDAIKDLLDEGLPRAYTPELYQQKCSSVYEHIYESYPQSGEGVYAGMSN